MAGSSAGSIQNSGILTIFNSTISNNATDNDGGGIWNSGTLTVTSSTIVGNVADYGGGIFASSGTASISNSTISGNFGRAVVTGAAIQAESGSAINLQNTILAESKDPTTLLPADNCYQAATEIQSSGYNLSDDASCTTLNATGDMQSVNAGLDPAGLQDNGGPTQTVALLQTSAARAAIATFAQCIPIPDQRGTPRPQGLLCDIGAYEFDGGGGTVRMVTSAAANGPGSLRDVIADAATKPDDIIQFDPSLYTPDPVILNFPRSGDDCGPLKLSRPTAIVIDKSLTIDGPGKELLTISGSGGPGDDCRVIWVELGISTHISGVTIADGQITKQLGANVYNNGYTTLSDCSIIDGHVVNFGAGAGIYSNSVAPLTLNNCVVDNNIVDPANIDLNGAGISNQGSGSLTLVDSTVSGNSGSTRGAGIAASVGSLTIISSTINNNTGWFHGGVYKNGGGDFTMTNSTISGNSQSDAGLTRGGGLWVESSDKALITNSTIVDNDGYNFISGQSNVGMKNTLIAGAGTQNCFDPVFSGSFPFVITRGHNLSDDASCTFFNMVTDLENANPGVLGLLQDNGGPTFTRALPEGSDALDAIPPGDCNLATLNGAQGTPNSVDQRGLPRPRGPNCDIGSFELAVSTLTVTSSVETGSGTISPLGEQTVDEGTSPEFTLTPAAGFHIDPVSGTCGGDLLSNIFTAAAITTDCTVEANFSATLCAVDQYVSSNACVACPAGTTNAAGDDASGSNTSCEMIMCAAGQWLDVPNSSCEAISTSCPAGTSLTAEATDTSDIVCGGVCQVGTWNDGSFLTCQTATTACPAGTGESAPATTTSDTMCGTSCVAGTDWNDGSLLSCQSTTVCGDGANEASAATTTMDTVCECAPGYTDGVVDGGIFSCTVSTCTLPGSFPQGFESGTCVAGATLGNGETCLLTCTSGLETVGDLNYLCTSGVLSPPTGQCQEPIIFLNGFEQ